VIPLPNRSAKLKYTSDQCPAGNMQCCP